MAEKVRDLMGENEDWNPEVITKDWFVDNSVHLLKGLLDRECKRYLSYVEINSTEEFNTRMECILRLMKDLDNMPFRAQDEHLLNDVFPHFILNVHKLKFMFEGFDKMGLPLHNEFYSETVQQQSKDIMIKLKDIVNKDYVRNKE